MSPTHAHLADDGSFFEAMDNISKALQNIYTQLSPSSDIKDETVLARIIGEEKRTSGRVCGRLTIDEVMFL